METTTATAYTTVTPDVFARDIKKSNMYILDVRHPDEFKEGHIANAHNLDVMDSDFLAQAEKSLPKDKTIAVYCGTGKRSGMASDILSKNGYKILNLEGGLTEWTEHHLQVVK